MSEDLLQKYKAYYEVRAQRYANNENYKNSYAAERKLADAIISCNTLEEIRDKMGNLNELCGTALLKDQYLMEKKHFEKHKEVIRVKEAEQVLEKIDQFDNVMDAISHVNDVSAKVRIEISMDESHPMQFFGDLNLLDRYIVYTNAEVPEKYKSDMTNSAEEIKQSLLKGRESIEKNNHEWQSGWQINPDICFEYRHFRKSPLKEEFLKELRELYRTIVQR